MAYVKSLLISILLLFSVGVVAPSDVNAQVLTISYGEPGWYGRLELGPDYPRPQRVYGELRLGKRFVTSHRLPVEFYHVPRIHYLRWGEFCRLYHACNKPVYFVTNRWYNTTYSPAYLKKHPKKVEQKGTN